MQNAVYAVKGVVQKPIALWDRDTDQGSAGIGFGLLFLRFKLLQTVYAPVSIAIEKNASL